jgi:hypothetical protein
MKLNTQQKGTRHRFRLFMIVAIIIAGIGYQTCEKKDHDDFFTQKSLQMDNHLNLPEEPECSIALNFYPGARQMYQLSIDKTDQTYPSALEGQSSENDNDYALQIHMEITGILNIRVFENDEWSESQNMDLIYMGCQMSPVTVQVGEKMDSMRRDKSLEQLFRNFFLVALRPDGLPDMFYFSSKLDPQIQTSLSEIFFSVQTYVPKVDSAPYPKRWLSDEKHAFGMLKVEYMIEPHHCNSLVKQNVRCTSLNDFDHSMLKTDQFQFRAILEQSNHHITLNENASWIESYTAEETFAIFASQHAVWYRRHTKVLMTPEDQRQPDNNLFIWKTKKPVQYIVNDLTGHSKAHQNQLSQRKQSFSERISLSDQLELFQKDIAANARQDVILKHIQSLKQFLTKFPEEASFIPDLIKNLNIQGTTVEHMILILEMVGHEDAQNAISDIYLDYNQDPDIRLKAVISAGGLSSPTPESIDRLFRLISQEQQKNDPETLNRSDSAILSLGLLNQRLYTQKQLNMAGIIHKRLVILLKTYSDERHLIACIKAMGNAKMPEGGDFLMPYIVSNSDQIRKAAIQAIGNIDVVKDDADNTTDAEPEILTQNETTPSESISTILLKQLFVENNSEIRREIYNAIIKRKESGTFDQLDDILQEEPDEQLREMIRASMGEH